MIQSNLLDPNPLKRRFLVFPAMLLPLLVCFFYFVWFPGTVLGDSLYLGIKFFMVIWPLVAVLWILKEKFNDTSRPTDHRGGMIAGGLFGLAVVGVMFGLMKLTPMGDVVYGNAERINQRIADLGLKEHFLVFAIFVSFAHAALEEFFWRYFIFGQLRKLMSVSLAVVLAGIGFALHHIVVMTQFVPLGWAIIIGASVGLGGAAWSIIYHRYNSLRGAWFSHMMIDLGIMWFGWELMQIAGK